MWSGVISFRAGPGAKLSNMVLIGSRAELVWSGCGEKLQLSFCAVLRSGRRQCRDRALTGPQEPCPDRNVFRRIRTICGFACAGPVYQIAVRNGRCPFPTVEIKRGRKNPTQHRYHITAQVSSQRPNGPPGRKSVPCTKTNVCIWETFRLEKLKIPCYLIVTKRNRKNTESSGGLPKANGKYGNQSDFKSK